MADVNNSIGLDASQAIAALDRLDVALDVATASMQRLARTASKGIPTPYDKVGESAKTAGEEGAKATKKIGEGAKKATQPVKGLGLAFGDVVRIVQSQIIFSAISNITTGFFEAADAAAELQEQVARINAIVDDGGLPDMAAALRELSAELGRPQAEVTEAAYEALQNDLGSTAETFEILRTQAQSLALVTGGTLPQAVNALSSVYKSYNDEQLKGVNVAGEFFGAINAGRITLGDLESSMGKLLPLATQLGIGLKTVFDAHSTITLTGTDAATAATQLRNVFNKLIKPTEALSDVYSDLGVTGFQQLQERTGGFIEALEALEGTVDGQEDGLSRLFNRLRANLGVLNLLTQEGKLFRETSERSAKSVDNLSESLEDIKSTPARRAAEQAAEFERILSEVGDRALTAKIAVNDFLLDAVTTGDQAILTIGSLASAIGAATVAVKVFGVAAKTALVFPAAFLAGYQATTFAINKLAEAQKRANEQEFLDSDVPALREFVDEVERLGKADLAEIDREFGDFNSRLNQTATAARKLGNDLRDAFDVDTTAIAETGEELIQKFTEGRREIIDSIDKQIKSIDEDIASGLRNIADLSREIEDRRFEFDLRNLSKVEQAAARINRATEDVEQSFKTSVNVGLSKESQEAALQQERIAIASADAARRSAERVGDERLIQQAMELQQRATTNQIARERELLRLRQDQSQKALVEQKQVLERLTADDRERLELALDRQKAVNDAVKSGADEAVVAGLRDDASRALNDALRNIEEFSNQEIIEKFGFDSLSSELDNRLREGFNQLNVDWDNVIASFRQELEAEEFEAAVRLKAVIDENAVTEELRRALAQAEGKGGTPGTQLQNAGEAVRDLNKEQESFLNGVSESAAVMQAATAEAGEFFRQSTRSRLGEAQFGIADDKGRLGQNKLAGKVADPTEEFLKDIGSKSAEEVIRFRSALVAGMAVVDEQGAALDVQRRDQLLKGMDAAMEAANARLEQIRQQGLFDPQVLEETRSLLQLLNDVSGEETILDVDDQGIRDANGQLDHTKQKADTASTATRNIGNQAIAATGGVNALTGSTSALTGQAQAASQAFRILLQDINNAIAAAANAPSGGGGGGTANAFHGGVQYRADGGATRGQDTISARLSPGEFVTPAKQTRNFLPELQAIGAGNFNGGGGGGDTNITIGDINVTSNSQVPTQTGRDVGNSIKRELRRGTIRL